VAAGLVGDRERQKETERRGAERDKERQGDKVRQVGPAVPERDRERERVEEERPTDMIRSDPKTWKLAAAR